LKARWSGWYPLKINVTDMRISNPEENLVANEGDMIDDLLHLESATVLELGCGNAEKTRIVARKAASVLALEVDERQLAKNLAIGDMVNVHFAHGGAERIPASDSSFDIVLMFKSLHHVPIELMDSAFSEIRRVLKPGGMAYISEPVYSGNFNEVLKLFHDEKAVRDAAFAAEKRAVASGQFALVTQKFFQQPACFANFSQYKEQVIKVTHTEHKLSEATLEAVHSRFNEYMTQDGATFHMPIRVDLLTRVAL